jgi:DNA-binding LytR/AlgR family response regulator
MSEKLKCLVLDDEPLGREIIEEYVNKTPFLELSASFGKPLEALNYLQENKIDILLTDIEMPQLNGLQFIESLKSKPLIIFITAYRDYAIEGFESGVVDYLVKPVAYNRFIKAITRAQESLKAKEFVQSDNEFELDRMFIKSDNRLVKIFFEDIVYIEALKDYLRIHISEKERYITHSTMKAMEEKLPDYFFRIQRSYIINTKYIKSFYGNTVKLSIGESLGISTNHKAELFKRLGIEGD